MILSCHDELKQEANLFIDSIKTIPMETDRDVQCLIAQTLIQSMSNMNGIYIDVACSKLVALGNHFKNNTQYKHRVSQFVSYFIYCVLLSLSHHHQRLKSLLDSIWSVNGNNIGIINCNEFKYYQQSHAYLSAMAKEVFPFTNYCGDITDIIVEFTGYKYYSFILDLNTLSGNLRAMNPVARTLLTDNKHNNDNIMFTIDAINATFMMQKSIQDHGSLCDGICKFFARHASITSITYSPKCFIELLRQFKELDTFDQTQNVLMRLISPKSKINSLFYCRDDLDESIEERIKFIFDQILIKYE
eukprot:214406_1